MTTNNHPARTELIGHRPDDQRHRVALTFDMTADADAALMPDKVLTYGGVMARRVSDGGRRVLVTSVPRYAGAYGYRHTNADVARVLATLARRATGAAPYLTA